MRFKIIALSILVLFSVGCTGMQAGGTGGTGSSSASGKKLTKEELKKLGIEETKGTDY